MNKTKKGVSAREMYWQTWNLAVVAYSERFQSTDFQRPVVGKTYVYFYRHNRLIATYNIRTKHLDEIPRKYERTAEEILWMNILPKKSTSRNRAMVDWVTQNDLNRKLFKAILGEDPLLVMDRRGRLKCTTKRKMIRESKGF